MWTLADRADRADRRMDDRLFPNKPRSSTAPGAVATKEQMNESQGAVSLVIDIMLDDVGLMCL